MGSAIGRPLRAVITAIVLGLAGLVIGQSGWLRPLDATIGDARFGLVERPVSDDYLFVALDAESLAEVGVWPWPRGLHAQLIDTVMTAGAYDVFVDIDFSTASNEEQDGLLEATLERSGGFARLAAFVQPDGAGTVHASVPLPRFGAHSDPFAVNVGTDSRGIARTIPTAIAIDGAPIPSLAGLAGRTQSASVTIDYGFDAGTVPTLSAGDVLAGAFDRESISGRKVVIGASALELQDFLFTPDQGFLPGAVIQILGAETVAANRQITTAPGWVVALILFAIALVMLLHRGQTVLGCLVLALCAAVAMEIGAVALYAGAAVMLPTAPLHAGLVLLVARRVIAEGQVRRFVVETVTGERNRMRNMLRRVIDDNFDGVVVIGSSGRIEAASGLAKAWFGQTLVGRPGDERLPLVLARAVEATGDGVGSLQTAMLALGERSVEIEYVVTRSTVPATQGGTFTTVTFRDVTERREAERRLAYLARHDTLTGALSRSAFVERREQARASSAPGAVIVLAIRRLAAINGALGHDAGDDLLRQVVSRMTGAGASDICRLGGDRFAATLAGSTDADSVASSFTALRTALCASFDLSGHVAVVGVSAGASLDADGADTVEQLRRADVALAAARSAGPNQMRLYDPAMEAGVTTNRLVEPELRAAIAHDQLCLFYQPQVSLADGRTIGAEALVRWRHPERGLLAPGAFISVAEETGLILQLGRKALDEGCRAAAALPDGVRIAVNVSPLQFELSDVVQDVMSSLARAGIPPSRLEIEVTEGVLVGNETRTIEALGTLRDWGVAVAIDDFGTGYSSLSYLARLPFDVLKIDRSFVVGLETDPRSAGIVRAIVAMGQTLDKTVLVEGIETEADADKLRAMGCDAAQGYFYSPPLPLDALTAWLQNGNFPASRAEAPSFVSPVIYA